MKYIIKYSIGGSNSQPIVFDHISQFNDITDDNIQQAVTLWLENKSKAITQYGHISDWDTSKVTNMNNLIKNIKYKTNRKQPIIPSSKKNNNYSHSYRKSVESKQN